ncbi:MAG: motif family protein [Enterovirga sp.]|nr:motif family protein [Enterovirga sp.]
MPRGPAARVADPVVHPLPPVLQPGPGSINVVIGGMPAWRGVSPAAAAAIGAAKSASDTAIAVAEAATVAAAGTPGLPAVKTAEETVKTTAASTMGSMITGSAGGADIHVCATPLPLPPHGPGVVIDGSTTVFHNSLAACRQMDTIMEALGPPNKIAMGCLTVIIGDQPNAQNSASTGLGADVDALANKSDTLAANIAKLQADGWTIQYGPAGKGSTCDKANKVITIDGSKRGNPDSAVRSLAHETGHAMYKQDPYVPPNGLTKDQYVAANVNRELKDEGEATLMNAQVRNEINGNGGSDIGISGAGAPKYEKTAAEDHDYTHRDAQRQKIGNEFADNEHTSTPPHPTYRDYYGKTYKDYYDANPPSP